MPWLSVDLPPLGQGFLLWGQLAAPHRPAVRTVPDVGDNPGKQAGLSAVSKVREWNVELCTCGSCLSEWPSLVDAVGCFLPEDLL